MPSYQDLKLFLLDALPASRDALHIYAGLICYGLSVAVLRRPSGSFSALALGFAASLVAELLDWRDHLRAGTEARLAAAARDVLHTNLAALVLVLGHRWRAARGRPRHTGTR